MCIIVHSCFESFGKKRKKLLVLWDNNDSTNVEHKDIIFVLSIIVTTMLYNVFDVRWAVSI